MKDTLKAADEFLNFSFLLFVSGMTILALYRWDRSHDEEYSLMWLIVAGVFGIWACHLRREMKNV